MDILFTPNSANPHGTEKSLTFDRTSEPLSYGLTELCELLGMKKLDAVVFPVDWSKRYEDKELMIRKYLDLTVAAKLIDENIEEAYVLLMEGGKLNINLEELKEIWHKENIRRLLKQSKFVIWTMHDWVALRVELAESVKTSTKDLAKSLSRALKHGQVPWKDEA